MSIWIVAFSKGAKRDFGKLTSSDKALVGRVLKRYAEFENGDVKKLQVDKTSEWRLRAGDWRIFFEKDPTMMVLNVLAIRNRKDSY